MKKVIAGLLFVVFLLTGCSQKVETKTITFQDQKGISLEFQVKHQGEEVTGFTATWIVENKDFQINDEASAKKFADEAAKTITEDLYHQMKFKGQKAVVKTDYQADKSVYVYKMDKEALEHVPSYSEVIASLK